MPTNSEIVSCGNKSLPRSLDVFVSVSKAQVEAATDLSITVFVTATGPLEHGANRIRFYQDPSDIVNDFGSSSEAAKAGRDFFSQRNRAKTLAIAQAFDTDQSGFLKTGAVDVAATIAVSDGEFSINIDGVTFEATGLDFTSDADIDAIAATVETELDSLLAGTTCVAINSQLLITSPTAGDSSTVSIMGTVAVPAGTDVSGSGFLNGVDGVAVPGYAPTDFTNELTLIEEAARCSGSFVYGWTLEVLYRDNQEALDAAAFAESRRIILGLSSNDPLAFDAGATSDIGFVLDTLGFTRTMDPIFHDNPEFYPEVSLLARMLGVDYTGINTAITAKFKDLPGIPTVGLSLTEWLTLESKGYNSFTLTGNNSRFIREGTQVSETFFIDDLINLDNFTEELEVSVLNAYLRNGKIALTPEGQAIKRDAIVAVCERYEDNGTFADREVIDLNEKSGVSTIPSYDIIFASLAGQTDADRASRIGPAVQIDVQMAGADHSTTINVFARD